MSETKSRAARCFAIKSQGLTPALRLMAWGDRVTSQEASLTLRGQTFLADPSQGFDRDGFALFAEHTVRKALVVTLGELQRLLGVGLQGPPRAGSTAELRVPRCSGGSTLRALPEPTCSARYSSQNLPRLHLERRSGRVRLGLIDAVSGAADSSAQRLTRIVRARAGALFEATRAHAMLRCCRQAALDWVLALRPKQSRSTEECDTNARQS